MFAPDRPLLPRRRFYAAAEVASPARCTREIPHATATPYNFAFATADRNRLMEAEHVNQIANSLADLANRTAELRRYL